MLKLYMFCLQDKELAEELENAIADAKEEVDELKEKVKVLMSPSSWLLAVNNIAS